MKRLMVAAVLAVTITACAFFTETVSEAVIERGGELYQTNCASCHVTDLAGAPDWKAPNEDSSYPAPPHDSPQVGPPFTSLTDPIVRRGSGWGQLLVARMGE